MGDARVDDVRRVLSEQELEPKCPECGSKKMFVSYSRDFVTHLEEETSWETDGSIDPYSITCFECGETIYEE